ncbi:MAG: hypothetical protein M1820_000954 [Bogoriella megaspora]|nr:MAG: hypothetical protein M1820_000954 [Bogoriella megaspora]
MTAPLNLAPTAAPVTDPTFRTYSVEQAEEYARSRYAYAKELYQFLFGWHAARGGSFEKLLDAGCGPGKATREMASSFDEVIGADAGPSMIETARNIGGITKTGKPIQWEISTAEELDKITGLEENSIDVITGATCAHWFTMEEFWPVAAKVVKPGGTVAFWCQHELHVHPSHPRASIIKEQMEQFMNPDNGAHEVEGVRIVNNYYRDLKLPWQIPQPVTAFPEEKYHRQEWDYDDNFADGKDFFGGSLTITISQLEHLFGTSSIAVRWREAHPDLVGTDEDLLTKSPRVLREAAGMQPDEDGELRIGGAMTMLLFQKL